MQLSCYPQAWQSSKIHTGAGSGPSRDSGMPTFHRNRGLQHISSNQYSAVAESKGKRGTKRGFSFARDLGLLLCLEGGVGKKLGKGLRRKSWGDRAAPTPLGHCCRVGPSGTLEVPGRAWDGDGMGTGWVWGAPSPPGTEGLILSSQTRASAANPSQLWPLQDGQKWRRGFGRGERAEKMLSPCSVVLLRPSQSTTRLGDALDKMGVLKEGFWNPKYLAGRGAEVMPLTPAGCSPRPLCEWFVPLSEPSIPPEEEKGPDTAPGVLPCHSAMDRALSPWERGSFLGSQNVLSC